MRALGLALGLLVLAAGVVVGRSAWAQTAPDPVVVDGWTYLGPPNGSLFTAIAVAPDWPVDPFLVGVRGRQVVRTRDGGATWEQASRPGPDLSDIIVGAAGGGGHVLFGVGIQKPGVSDGALYRSADDGETWTKLFDVPGWFAWRSGRPLRLSPSFAADGTVMIASDGRLMRSTGYGVSWDQLDPFGQPIRRVEFSPVFSTDHTVFGTVTTGMSDTTDFVVPGPQLPVAHNEQSTGVVVSRDGGTTWQTASIGLEINGVPFRYVQSLAVSPTYAQDNTLFALGWGPRPMDASGYHYSRWPAALFRSTDGARTWTVVRQSVDLGEMTAAMAAGAQIVTVRQQFAQYAFSPHFADDRLMVLALTWSDLRHSYCELLRTSDGGDTWAPVTAPQTPQVNCEQPIFTLEGATPVVYLLRRTDARFPDWYRSPDGGAVWEPVRVPGGPDGSAALPPPTAFASDGTMFMGRGSAPLPDGTKVDGVWARGPSARPGASNPAP